MTFIEMQAEYTKKCFACADIAITEIKFDEAHGINKRYYLFVTPEKNLRVMPREDATEGYFLVSSTPLNKCVPYDSFYAWIQDKALTAHIF